MDGAGRARARAAAEKGGIGLVWSPNFSIGVNVFLASGGGGFATPGAVSGIWRVGLGDSPLHQERRAQRHTAQDGGRDEEAPIRNAQVDVSSSRAGAHPGTHEAGFDSAADTITLRHTARSREGFARGALQAARWVIGKKGWFEFRDMLFEK